MSRQARPRGKSLGRRVGGRRPRKTLVVFCEGSRTEPDYLEALKRDPEVRARSAVELRVEVTGSGAVPLTLVRKAVAARERARQEQDEVDEFWCVFDVEWPRNHPHLVEAVALARRHDVRVAISNPCFELWLVLHFHDQRSFLDTHAAVNLRRGCDGQPGKALDGVPYMPLKDVAADRARSLDERHARDGTAFPHDNPSSGMHRLIAAVTATG
jgi:RloB-like protein